MKKIAELRSLTVDALSEELATLQEQLRVFKSSHAITPLKNPRQITSARKSIARIKTLLTQKSNTPTTEEAKAPAPKAATPSEEKQPAKAAPAASKASAAKK